MRKQLLPVHLAAYILVPENQGAELTRQFAEQLENYLLEKLGDDGYNQ